MEFIMKFIINSKKILPVLGAICLLPLSSQNAFASSSISSIADLLFSVNITAQGPGSVNDLLISDSFEMLTPSESEPVSGIGTFTVTPNNLSAYQKQLTLVSDVQNGYANLSELGWIDLHFDNASADTSYDVEVSLAYDLTSYASANVAGGDVADTDILLSFYNNDNSFSGEDYVSSYANLSSQLDTILQSGSSGVFSFTLAPGASETFFTDVKMTANLEASPVPIPAAIWLFGSALMAIPGLNGFKTKLS
jgi:hypothetical protein